MDQQQNNNDDDSNSSDSTTTSTTKLPDLTTLELSILNITRITGELKASSKPTEDIPEFVVSLQLFPGQHDAVLLELWSEYAEVLTEGANSTDDHGNHKDNNPENQFWLFDNMKLPPSMNEVLWPAMAKRHIHTMEFRNDDSGNSRALFPYICSFLEENPRIKRLVFTKSAMFGARFYQALAHHPGLEELHVVSLGLGRHAGTLSKILDASRNLKYLNLKGSFLGKEGGTIISQFLECNHGLQHLYLGNCQGIGDDDATKFAMALRVNTNLRVLTLSGRKNVRVTVKGRDALAATLFDVTSLDCVAKSNHTCFVQTLSRPSMRHPDPCPIEELLDSLNRHTSPEDNREWKVLSVLYATNGKGIIENDEFECYRGLKLIPDMLAFISGNSRRELFDESLVSENTTHMPQDMGDTTSTGLRSAIGRLIQRLPWSITNNHDKAAEDSDEDEEAEGDYSDIASVESDETYNGYDSELEELDEAFEDDVDEAYEDFVRSFSDSAFSGQRVRLTVMFQVIKLWGMDLLETNPTTASTTASVDEAGAGKTNSGGRKPKRRRDRKPKRRRREESLSDILGPDCITSHVI